MKRMTARVKLRMVEVLQCSALDARLIGFSGLSGTVQQATLGLQGIFLRAALGRIGFGLVAC